MNDMPFAAFMMFFGIPLFIGGICAVVTLVSYAKLYMKAGRPWWAALVPFYASYTEFDIIFGHGLWFLKLLIPLYNIYVEIKMCIGLAQCYGKDVNFAIGLVLLPIVFLPILAFDESAQYHGVVGW